VNQTHRTLALLLAFGIGPAAGFAQQPPPAPAATSAQAPSAVPAQDTKQQAASPAAPGQATAPNKIVRTTQLVEMVATVSDRRHKLITDLEQRDFQIKENNRPETISFFNRQTDLPLRIGILLDTSNSIRDRLRFEQDAAIDFLGNVIRRNKDMAFLMTFDNEPEVIQDFTGDMGAMDQAIQKQRAGGGTALRDAIYVASQKMMNPPLPVGDNPSVRRVLVVISDGDDNLSDHAQSEAMEMAERAGALIYCISTNTDWVAIGGDGPKKLHKSHGEDVLEYFADQTGGTIFFPYKIDDLAGSFTDISNELRNQYLLGYSPSGESTAPGYRKIQVETDRKGLIVRTRKGYYVAAVSGAAAGSPAAPH
jgi:Ca-activated chloride channel family protein